MNFNNSSGPWTQEHLLSFVLNGASKFQDVEKMAQEFSIHFKSLSQLMQMDERSLMNIRGIGPVKAKQIMEVVALYKEWNRPKNYLKV